MPETITQINYLRDGITTVGEYHDPAIQASIEASHARLDTATSNFQEVVDGNNLNDQYSNVLSLTHKYFTDQALEPAPLRVVDGETFSKAYEAAGTKNNAVEADGQYVNGRAIVVENPETLEVFGDDDVLGVMLHEAAHSLGQGEHLIRKVREQQGRIALGGIAVGLGGMNKANLREGAEAAVVGDFWEEAFADLTRVKGLRQLGHNHDLESNSNPFEINGVAMVVVPNASRAENPGTISLPAEFAAQSTTTSGKNYVAHSAPNYAAYALELLDTRVPGLYDDLLAARQNPIMQPNAIQKIETVQTGLYKQLRDLDYTNEDFASGLKFVVDALEDHESKQEKSAA